MARVHGNESMRALADERGGDCINYMHIARSTKHDRMDVSRLYLPGGI